MKKLPPHPSLITTVFATLLTGVLVGCSAEGTIYEDDYYDSYSHDHTVVTEEVVIIEEPYPPADSPVIEKFNITDSYGRNTELDGRYDLHLNADVDGGHFEVYWSVFNLFDYIFSVSINDSPTVYDSTFITEQLCGVGLDCDTEGMLFCSLDNDHHVTCEEDLFSSRHSPVSIEHYLTYPSEVLYLVVEACDIFGASCQYDYQAITVESHGH